MSELKPCPFCGAEIKIYTVQFNGEFAENLTVKCENCNTEFWIREGETAYTFGGEKIRTHADAIRRWNRRASGADMREGESSGQ